MLLAATDKGICRLSSFDEDADRACSPVSQGRDRGGWSCALEQLVTGAIAAIEHPAQMPDLPLDVAGTAVQQAIWNELRRIPAGETRTYADIAAAVGKPKAVRAAGLGQWCEQCCGPDPLSPGHPHRRQHWVAMPTGLERKEKCMLSAERKSCMNDKIKAFGDLHVPGKPLILYNIWDAGSAKAVADAGAQGDRHRKLGRRLRAWLQGRRDFSGRTRARQSGADYAGDRLAGDARLRVRIRRGRGGGRGFGRKGGRCRARSASIWRTRIR